MVSMMGMMRKTVRKNVPGKRYLAGTNLLVEYSRNMAPGGQDDDSQPQPHPIGDKKRDEVDRCDQREGTAP